MTAIEAGSLLLASGFQLIRSKGSHRIYVRNSERIVIPFHAGKMLHPKIAVQVIKAVENME